MKDPCEVLGGAQTDSPEEIRKAYLRLAKKLHPDLNRGSKPSEERVKEVLGVYQLLSDPQGDSVKSCEESDGAISVVLKFLDRSRERGRDGLQDFAREA